MIITTKGIVLRERSVGENDKFIEILTEDMGVIESLVRGSKKMTSKNSAATQLLTYSVFCLNKTQKGYAVNSTQALNNFYNIRLDVKKLALCTYLSDIIRFTTPSEEPSKPVLRLFLNTLFYINNDSRDLEQMKGIFEMRIMCQIGLMPNLIGCYNCYKSSDDLMYFNLYEGRLCCENCLTESENSNSFPVDDKLLHIIRYVCLSDFEMIFKVKFSESYQLKFSHLSEKFIEIQLNKHFKSLEFYRKI